MRDTFTSRDTLPVNPDGAVVLAVDRDENQLDSICRGVFLHGHRCVRLASIGAAIDYLNDPASLRVDILVTDLEATGTHAFDLVRHARAMHPNLPIIGICGLVTTDEIEELHRSGVLILRRPFNSEGLDDAIQDLVA